MNEERPPAMDVLVVSYRRADLLARCLRSVGHWLPSAHVHVWDNASEASPEIEALARTTPDVDWVFSAENAGFARSVNALARRATGEQMLLLNPDAELLGDLTATRAALAADPRVAAAAPLVVGGPFAWDNAHRPIGLTRALVSYAGWGPRLRAWPVSDLYPKPPAGDVGYLTGSCLLVSRRAWSTIGPFDERYFLYSEEVDWCARARSAGWRLRLVPEDGARHMAGGTVSDRRDLSSRSSRLLQRSRITYLQQHQGFVAAAAYRAGASVLERVQRSKRSGQGLSA